MITSKKIDIIYKLYPQVIRTIGDEAFDSDGNKVEIDQSLIDSEISKTAYIAKRQAEYPPITDYIDGVVKGDQTQIQAYIDACLAVKEKYPKS